MSQLMVLAKEMSQRTRELERHDLEDRYASLSNDDQNQEWHLSGTKVSRRKTRVLLQQKRSKRDSSPGKKKADV